MGATSVANSEDVWAYGVGSCSFVRVQCEKEFGDSGSGHGYLRGYGVG